MPVARTKNKPVKADAQMDVIKAQPGPQEQFLRSRARVAFYGGAAGG